MSGTNIQTFFDYFLVIVIFFNIFVANNDELVNKKGPDLVGAFFLIDLRLDQLADTGADEALYPRIRLITLSEGEKRSFPKASFPFWRVSKVSAIWGTV